MVVNLGNLIYKGAYLLVGTTNDWCCFGKPFWGSQPVRNCQVLVGELAGSRRRGKCEASR